MSFDPVAAAEALTAYEFAFLLNAERANRLVQFKAQEGNIGFDDVLDALIDNVWKKDMPSGLQATIQMQTQLMLIKYMQGLMAGSTANLDAKAICFDRLQKLKEWMGKQKKKHKEYEAHYSYAINLIRKPDATYTLPDFKTMPPGAPIGCDWDL